MYSKSVCSPLSLPGLAVDFSMFTEPLTLVFACSSFGLVRPVGLICGLTPAYLYSLPVRHCVFVFNKYF